MSPQVRRQLVAVIDKRTTIICLHAAGQIQPLDKPFTTLAGDFDIPPFHVHCRSTVAPWMSGFWNDQRRKANDEMRRRPPSQRVGKGGWRGRLPDTRYRGRLPPPPPKKYRMIGGGMGDVDPEVQRWADELAEGADIRDVPEEIRGEVLRNSGRRFELTINPSEGTNQSWVLTDKLNGDRWFLKADTPDGAFGELSGSEIGRAMGIDMPEVLFGGRAGEGRAWIIVRHIDDEVDGSMVAKAGRKVLGRKELKAGDELADGLITLGKKQYRLPDDDLARIQVLDFVTSNSDRHGGNLAVMLQDDGTLRLLPIDQGFALTRKGKTWLSAADRIDWADKKTLESLQDWYEKGDGVAWARRGRTLLNSDLSDAAKAARRAGLVTDSVDDSLRKLADFDWDAFEDRMRARARVIFADDTEDVDGWVHSFTDMMRKRADRLLDERRETLRVLGVTDDATTSLIDELDDLGARIDALDEKMLRNGVRQDDLKEWNRLKVEWHKKTGHYYEERGTAYRGAHAAGTVRRAESLADLPHRKMDWNIDAKRDGHWRSVEQVDLSDRGLPNITAPINRRMEAIDELDRLHAAYPEIDFDVELARFSGIGDTWGQAATYWHNVRRPQVLLSERMMNMTGDILDDYKMSVRSGFHPKLLGRDEGPASEFIRSVTAHEFGHHVGFRGIARQFGDGSMILSRGETERAYDLAIAEMNDVLRPFSIKFGRTGLTRGSMTLQAQGPSAYAETNLDELIAESFLDVWWNDGQAKPVSKAVTERVLNWLRS